MAKPVSLPAESITCSTPHVGDDTDALVGSMVPGSLSVLVALAAVVDSVPGGSGFPGQVALLLVIGESVVEDVQVTLVGVVPWSSKVPVENVPDELLT